MPLNLGSQCHLTVQFQGLLKGVFQKKRETDWQGKKISVGKWEVQRREKMQSEQFCSLGLCGSGLTKTKEVTVVTLCQFRNVIDIYLCSVGVAFGHWPGTVNVTSVKQKKKRLFLSLSSLVLHVSSVSLSVCFVSAYVVLLTYSRCCQSTSNLKVKNLDHHSLVYHTGIACCLDCTFSARRVSKMARRNFCGVTVTPEPQPTYCT